jgi:hypothetical protein
MEIPTPAQLMALPPAYLAQDTSRVLFKVTVAMTVLTTLVYILFLVARVFCVERNKLEVWILPMFSYIFCVGLWTLSYRKFAPCCIVSPAFKIAIVLELAY